MKFLEVRPRKSTKGRPIRRRAQRAAKPKNSFEKRVMAVVTRKAETKYVAKDFGINVVPSTLLVPSNLQPVLPGVAIGTASSQRVGQKITNVHGRVDFHFYFAPNTDGETPNGDVIVKIFKLTSKQAKAYPQIATLSNNTLLDNGNSTSTDWVSGPSSFALAAMPLSKEDFAGSVATIRIVKNPGPLNGAATLGLPAATQKCGAANYSYSWSHKGTLMYDDLGGAVVPTNYAPVFGVVAYCVDSLGYPGNVQYYTRSHMWYKDV